MFVPGVRSSSASMSLPVARSSMKTMYDPGSTHPVDHVVRRVDLHPAEHKGAPGAEPVRVEPDAHPDHAAGIRVAGEQGLGQHQVFGHGHLQVGGIARDEPDGNPQSLHQHRVVGPAKPLPRRRLMRALEERAVKRLGGLDPIEGPSVEGFKRPSSLASLDRLGDRQGGRRRPGAGARRDHLRGQGA